MLKRISIKQIRLGMHIHKLTGSWIDHPFWRQSFKLDDADTLRQLRESPVKEVIIDTSKGLDVVDEDPTKPEPPPAVQHLPAKTGVPGTKRISAQDERRNALKVIKASKEAVVSMFNEARMGKAINAEAAKSLVDDIVMSVNRNESALISLVRLKGRDEYTYLHSVAVCALMVALARELELSGQQIRQAGLGGLLHDIGKKVIPLEVLNKPGALNEREFDIVRQHPRAGYEILQRSPGVDEVALDICLHHHEKMDGTGYPEGLKGEQISLFARMGAVCDVYDAVTSNRPYKSGWEPGVSLQRMARWSGNHFDDAVFKAFVKSVGIYPIGSMVMLKSGKLAVVIDQTPSSLLEPIIKVFFSTKSKTRIPVEVVDLSKQTAKEMIVGHEDPKLWGINDVNDIWSQ